MIVAGGIGEYFIAGRQIRFIVSFSGVAVFIIGVSLRNLSIRTLGTSWSIHVCADNVERIVKKGPYRYIRHPYYLGSLLSLLGILLISNSYYAIMLIVLVQLPLYLMRMRLEEECLLEKFGKEYIVYKKGVWI
ncbi:MAG: isoprenylcysteine carboxylmethyltransferase family protein [Candidatus Omnitrophica bacterium]|nr:isoprenylcysteine carboxylmethyltransferase family protein [Candidatus Omnitrophota bacterium]